MNTSEVAAQWRALTIREHRIIYMNHKPMTSIEDQDSRALLVKWSYRVVDKYRLDRSVVSVAFSYFDRFWSLHSDSVDFQCGQLLAMTCLYLAAKIQSRRHSLSISRLIRLSRGYFQANQVLDMERCVLNTLCWYLNPPIPILFLDTVRALLFANKLVSNDSKDFIYDLSVYLIELSVCDHYFITKRPSSIASAALLVALEISGADVVLQVPCPVDIQMTDACVNRLRKLHSIANPDKEEASRCSDSSPTDVLM